jgi:hypothetical protein
MKEAIPPDDLEQTILETFDEMHAEAQIAPMFLTFPLKVIERIVAYIRDHSLAAARLIPWRSKPRKISRTNSAKRASA